MPVRPLPANPNLQHLKYQAKDLLKEHAARDAGVAQRLREFHPRFHAAADDQIFSMRLSLNDAQLAIARESGFPTWARLKRHVEKPTLADRLDLPHHERIEDPQFRHAVDLLDTGDAAGLTAYLRQHPDLVHRHIMFEGGNYFRNPTLLEFIAENPVRHGALPENIVEIARIILDAGPEPSALNEALMLVATGSVPRECRVQIPLIHLLGDRGADLESAMEASVLHGELESANALTARGARITFPVAAGLGRVDEFSSMLATADSSQRHLAFALASQYDRVEVVRLLLDAGEDPSRYNPIGGHSHCTPLHQAAASGNQKLARLLIERGARLDLKDIMWHATPAEWAHHEGKTEMEAYLRAQSRK